MPLGGRNLNHADSTRWASITRSSSLILAGSDFSGCFGFNYRRCFVQPENSLPSGQQNLEDFRGGRKEASKNGLRRQICRTGGGRGFAINHPFCLGLQSVGDYQITPITAEIFVREFR